MLPVSEEVLGALYKELATDIKARVDKFLVAAGRAPSKRLVGALVSFENESSERTLGTSIIMASPGLRPDEEGSTAAATFMMLTEVFKRLSIEREPAAPDDLAWTKLKPVGGTIQ